MTMETTIFGSLTGVGKCPNVSHHPTLGDIIPSDIFESDVKQIPKKGHVPTLA